MTKKAKDRKRAEDTLNSLPADAIMNSPIMKAIQRSIIKQTYLGGVVMACLIVGLWNIINALKIDAVQSGVVSLSIGVIFLAVQLRTLFNSKPHRKVSPSSPVVPGPLKEKFSFPCPKCSELVPVVPVAGKWPESVKCPKCGAVLPKLDS